MARPLVIAYHLIWSAYGWWLPNDPRGSTSPEVADEGIAQLGPHHYGRRRDLPTFDALERFQAAAEDVLKFKRLPIGEAETRIAGQAFGETIRLRRYTCYACAIMPDHVHILMRKHRDKAEEMIEALQSDSGRRLRGAGLRPADHPVWTEGGWKGFLDHPDEVRGKIAYIEGNPAKHHLPRQVWPFVIPYDGWPLHPGHNPNSPYARRLRGD
jgi:REP element-mobilizing transposase RayT